MKAEAAAVRTVRGSLASRTAVSADRSAWNLAKKTSRGGRRSGGSSTNVATTFAVPFVPYPHTTPPTRVPSRSLRRSSSCESAACAIRYTVCAAFRSPEATRRYRTPASSSDAERVWRCGTRSVAMCSGAGPSRPFMLSSRPSGRRCHLRDVEQELCRGTSRCERPPPSVKSAPTGNFDVCSRA